MKTSLLPILVIGVPVICSLLILFCGDMLKKFREIIAISAASLAVLATFFLIPDLISGGGIELYFLQMLPQVWIYFRVDQLGLFFAIALSTLWLLATIYSLGYMKDEPNLERYYGFLVLCLAFSMGIAFAGNLFTLLIFYELLSLNSYVLISQYQTADVLAAAKKYLIYVLCASIFIIAGVIAVYSFVGTEDFSKAGLLSLDIGRGSLILMLSVFIIGFGVKAAIMPFHDWVPDAHPAAPSSVSALLSGVIVATGCFGIMRVAYNIFGVSLLKELGVTPVISWIASITIVLGALIALGQDNLKVRLAWSTISQMSLIILGIFLFSMNSTLGAMIHILNHAYMKGVLFLCAGVLIKQANKKNISEMAGIGHRYPVTMGAFTIASLGLIGIPPLCGFISKWYLCLGAFEAKQVVFLLVILLGSLLCAAYLLPVCIQAFFQKPQEAGETVKFVNVKVKKSIWLFEDTPLTMLIPIVIGVAGIIILGIFIALPGSVFALIKIAAETFLK